MKEMSQDSSQRRQRAAQSSSAGHVPIETLSASSAGNSGASKPWPVEPTERAPTPSNPGEQLPFSTWDRYRLITFLGAGGMGSVYKALDPRLGRMVAIKFLRSSHLEADHLRQRRRFEREARAQASLDHPHICKIREV